MTTVENMMKRYQVEMRTGPQTVTHATYGFSTRISPLQFAVYEVGMKAVCLSNLIFEKNHSRVGANSKFHDLYKAFFAANGIAMPILDTDATDDGRQAFHDYHWALRLLTEQTGIDIESGQQRDLYFALFD